MPSQRRHKRRGQQSKSVSLQDQSFDYYSRLLHQCEKTWNKQIKAVKKVERLKLSRRLASQPSSLLEEEFNKFKALSVDSVVQEAMRRLGIKSLDPMLNQKNPSGDDGQVSGSTARTGTDGDTDTKRLIENILSHSRLIPLMEEWNAEISKYRQWYLKQQKQQQQQQSAEPHHRKRQKLAQKQKPKVSKGRMDSDDDDNYGQEEVTFSQSVFHQLRDEEDGDEESEIYNSDNDDVEQQATKQKKNRPGQRARKAKALALEQRQQQQDDGRQKQPAQQASFNWRGGGGGGQQKVDKSAEKQQGKKRQKDDEGPLHPSWAAQKAQSKGIVRFQGTKTSFRDDEDE